MGFWFSSIHHLTKQTSPGLLLVTQQMKLVAIPRGLRSEHGYMFSTQIHQDSQTCSYGLTQVVFVFAVLLLYFKWTQTVRAVKCYLDCQLVYDVRSRGLEVVVCFLKEENIKNSISKANTL